ncbi:MAG: hypothetical protein ACR5KW_04120 [Wolbachia sp.]
MIILTFGNEFFLPLDVASVISIFPKMADTVSSFIRLMQFSTAFISSVVADLIS